MFRMELFSSVVIRAMLISIGYFSALYIAYKIKPSKRSLLDIVLIFGLMLLMSTRVEWILLKMMSYFALGYALLTLNHKKNIYGSLLFSLILVMMTSVSDLISMNIMSLSEPLLSAVVNQEENIYGFIAIFLPSFVVMSMYILSALIVRKTLDLTNERSKITYIIFSIFYLFMLVQISLLLQHVVTDLGLGVPLKDVFAFISFIYIPLLFIVIYSYYYLHRILHWEKMIKVREEELLTAEHKRRDGYRANHNVESIILTIHTLTKNQQYDELKTYLDKL